MGQEVWDKLARTWGLSSSEVRVIRHLASGATEAETAAALGMSASMVHHYAKRLRARLHVGNRARLAVRVENLLRALGDGASPSCSSPP